MRSRFSILIHYNLMYIWSHVDCVAWSSNEFLSVRCFLPQLSSSAKLLTYKAEVGQDKQTTVPIVQQSLCVIVWTSCVQLRRVYEIKTYTCMYDTNLERICEEKGFLSRNVLSLKCFIHLCEDSILDNASWPFFFFVMCFLSWCM